MATWQQANIQAAAAYMRERMAAGALDPRTMAVYEGLLDLLDPPRRAVRMQRESAQAVKAAAQAERVRRAAERRRQRDRRLVNLGPPGGTERRRTPDRRSGRDRRS